MTHPHTSLSFEFFPPKSEASMEALIATHQTLSNTKPDFYSVTYGATGADNAGTCDTVSKLQGISHNIAAHISFSGGGDGEVNHLLDVYRGKNVRRLVAILGDGAGNNADGTPRHAIDMVRFVRAHSDAYFHISVASYPEMHPHAKSPEDDLRFLKGKLDAGSNQSITQFFYGYDVWQDFYERCMAVGINKPIIPGIMPISVRLPSIAKRCGAHVPNEILESLQRYGDNHEDLLKFNIDYLSRLGEKLLASGAGGLHFYTMNQAQPSLAIWEHINKQKV